MKIGVIDYGMGNLFSVEQALKRLNVEVIVSSEINALRNVDGLVLPGVGAFPDAMKRLEQEGLISFLQDMHKADKPLLGICLGMQLLFESSEEVEETKGLGFFKGQIKRFTDVTRIPHMGWNNLAFSYQPSWLEDAERFSRYVYFVHSFYATNIANNELIAFADYEGVQVPGIVANGSFVGMQFHPEKSGEFGLHLLEGWLKGVAATC